MISTNSCMNAKLFLMEGVNCLLKIVTFDVFNYELTFDGAWIIFNFIFSSQNISCGCGGRQTENKCSDRMTSTDEHQTIMGFLGLLGYYC